MTSSKALRKLNNWGEDMQGDKREKNGEQRIYCREQKSPSQAETVNGNVDPRFINTCASLGRNLWGAIFLAMYPAFWV